MSRLRHIQCGQFIFRPVACLAWNAKEAMLRLIYLTKRRNLIHKLKLYLALRGSFNLVNYQATNWQSVCIVFQFMYTRLTSCGCRQHSSGLHHLRSVYQQSASSFLETAKSPTVPGPEDARRCPNGIDAAVSLCLPGSMRTCIVMQQNNYTRELASSGR